MLYMFSLKLFEHFFFFPSPFSLHCVAVNTSYSRRSFSFGYLLPLLITAFSSPLSPPPRFPIVILQQPSGPLARPILTEMLGMLPSVSNWGCLLLLLCLLVLLPHRVIWSIRTDFCIFNVPFTKNKLLGFRRALKCASLGIILLASLTHLTPSQLNYMWI